MTLKKTKPDRSKSRQLGIGKSEPLPDNVGNAQNISALSRGLQVLGAFRHGDDFLGNHELAERTGFPKSTTSRICLTLVQEGYLRYDQRLRMYELGSNAFSLAYVATANNGIKRMLQPLMKELAKETGWNVALGIRDRSEMLYIESCATETMIELRVYPGYRLPLMTSSIGRAYLAATDQELCKTLMAAYPNDRLGQKADLVREQAAIERAIENGFSDSIGDWHPDVHSVATAFTEPGTEQIYCVSLGAPRFLMSRDAALETAGPRIEKFMADLHAELKINFIPKPASHNLDDERERKTE